MGFGGGDVGGQQLLELFHFGHTDMQGHDVPRITSYNVCYTQLLRNCDGRVHVARIIDVAHTAPVVAAAKALEFVDDFHRPNLRCARERSGWERRPQEIQPVEVGPQFTLIV